jgi:hypothetical protein
MQGRIHALRQGRSQGFCAVNKRIPIAHPKDEKRGIEKGKGKGEPCLNPTPLHHFGA